LTSSVNYTGQISADCMDLSSPAHYRVSTVFYAVILSRSSILLCCLFTLVWLGCLTCYLERGLWRIRLFSCLKFRWIGWLDSQRGALSSYRRSECSPPYSWRPTQAKDRNHTINPKSRQTAQIRERERIINALTNSQLSTVLLTCKGIWNVSPLSLSEKLKFYSFYHNKQEVINKLKSYI